MAIPSYLTFTPNSGNGNSSVEVKASKVHTGRQTRTTEVPGKIVGQADSVTVTVNEEAKPEFVQIQQTASPSKDGEVITLTGTSNSPKLTFSVGSGDLEIALPGSYTAGGVSTTNGAEISGDPGATAQFNFSIQITIPENTTTAPKTQTISVQGSSASVKATCAITQSAGDPYLWINSENNTTVTITLTREGTAQTFNVLSNTNWTFTGE